MYAACAANKFQYDKRCEETFECIKALLLTNSFLLHTDSQKQLILACDASNFFIAAVLL